MGLVLTPNAASVYGDLGVTKKEIFEIAAKPNGLQLLVERFNNGSAAIAQEVLDDFKSEGPMSQEAADFVGGAEYFMGYETGGLNERKRVLVVISLEMHILQVLLFFHNYLT